jgi:choline dehydrogenase-like flavoprotein
MRRYTHQVNFGALVGSDTGATVEARANILDGRSIDWRLTPRDVENLKFTLGTLVELARHGGASRVTLRTEPGLSFEPTAANCERFIRALAAHPLELSNLALATSHPQGGNRMAGARSSPVERETAVVDERFRVRGWKNVYVADASVFPTGITVNPQWTVFVLASIAGRCVLEDCEDARPSVAAGAPTRQAAE